jgi:hypothetical protein
VIDSDTDQRLTVKRPTKWTVCEDILLAVVAAVQLDVEKLFMITEALWNILKEKHGYADEDLLQMVQDIDLRDGQLDGKVARQPNPPCSNCGRTLMGRHPVCLYCGAVAVRAPFDR